MALWSLPCLSRLARTCVTEILGRGQVRPEGFVRLRGSRLMGGFQSEPAQHWLFRRFQSEIAAFQKASDPLEELAKGFRKHRLHIFVAPKEDDLADATARPGIEIETDIIA